MLLAVIELCRLLLLIRTKQPHPFVGFQILKKSCLAIFCYDELMEDTPKIAKRRAREKRVISQMIAIYCSAHHDKRDHRSYSGDMICADCAMLDEYAVMRTERCKKMDQKTSCEECENHCYKPEERQRIREVMRYAGPRMITKHPLEAIRHLLGK